MRLLAATGVGVVIWRGDEHARDDSRAMICLERAHATAAIALLAPAARIDANGRLKAMQSLGKQLEGC